MGFLCFPNVPPTLKPHKPLKSEPAFSQVWLQEPQFLQVLEDADIDIHNKATFLGFRNHPKPPGGRFGNQKSHGKKKKQQKTRIKNPGMFFCFDGIPWNFRIYIYIY